jgi:hypothetical protein
MKRLVFSVLVGANVCLFLVAGVFPIFLNPRYSPISIGSLRVAWYVSMVMLAVWSVAEYLQHAGQSEQKEEKYQGWKPPEPQKVRNAELRKKRLARRRRRKKKQK